MCRRESISTARMPDNGCWKKLPLIIREASENGGKQVQLKLAAYSEELERKLAAFQSEVDNAETGGG